MGLKTIDVNVLADQTGSVYKAVAVLSKRARQISSSMKAELDDKLSYFEGFEPELEDPRFREEQARISLEYEVKDEPTEFAVDEMYDHEIFFRASTAETEE